MYGVSKIENGRRHESLAGSFADTTKCLSPASFWMPRWRGPSDWLQHAPFAFWLIDKARPRTIVELGTYRGFSYLALCQAVHDLGLGTTCRAIGNWAGDRHTGLQGDKIFSELKDYHDTHYAGFSELIRSTSADGLDSFSEHSIDLLHIDGSHLHEDVLDDLDRWLPKLSKSSLALLHNIREDKSGFGVARLWRELRARYPSFEFKHGRGLGILAVGSEMPLSLRPLFLATEATRDAIEEIYERLGLGVKDQFELSALRWKEAQEGEELARLKSELEARAESFRELRAEIDGLRAAMTARPIDEIAPLRATLGEMHRELTAHKDRIAVLEGELAAKAGEVAALKSQAEAQQATRDMLDTLNRRLIEDNEQLHRDVESYALVQRSRDNQVSSLRTEIAAHQTANETLRAEIGEARDELASSVARSKNLEERLEEARQILTSTRDRSQILEERLTAMESELAEAGQELTKSRDRSKALEERLAAMESSTSWKLTQPLRSLSHAARRLAKRTR